MNLYIVTRNGTTESTHRSPSAAIKAADHSGGRAYRMTPGGALYPLDSPPSPAAVAAVAAARAIQGVCPDCAGTGYVDGHPCARCEP